MFSDTIHLFSRKNISSELRVVRFLKPVTSSDVLAYSIHAAHIFSSWKGGQESLHNLIDICCEIGIAHSSSGVKKHEFWEANVYFVL